MKANSSLNQSSHALEMKLYSSNTSASEADTSTESTKQSQAALPTWSPFDILKNFTGGHVLDSVFTLLAAAIGCGVMMISNAMSASGFLWSVIQMFVCGFLSFYSLVTLVKAGDALGVYSYQDLALNTFGHWCRQLVNVITLFMNWGSVILYLKIATELLSTSIGIFFGTSVPVWLRDHNSPIFIFLIATLFIYPLAVGQEYKTLRYLSATKFLFVMIFMIVVIYEVFEYDHIWANLHTVKNFQWAGFATTAPTSFFAFSSHPNALDVYRELRNRRMEKMIRVLKWSVFTAFLCYIIVGSLGYLTFAANLTNLHDISRGNGILLVAYGWTIEGIPRAYPKFVVFGTVGMSLAVIISQAFNIRPAKASLRNLFRPFNNASRDKNAETPFERYFYAAVVLYSAVVVVLIFHNAQVILDLVGSSVFPLNCMILPSLFYLKAKDFKTTAKESLIHYSMIIIMTIFMLWTTYKSIIEAIVEPNS